jgi:hypothetical protein
MDAWLVAWDSIRTRLDLQDVQIVLSVRPLRQLQPRLTTVSASLGMLEV